METGLRRAIRNHPLLFYFLFAYLITWIVMIPYTLSAWGVIAGDRSAAFIPHIFGPALAAVMVTGLVEGRRGLLVLRDHVRRWR